MAENWTYYNANTIQVAGNLTTKYLPNQLLRVTQDGTVKFFLVTAVTLVNGNTHLTVSGSGIYTLTSSTITARAMAAQGSHAGVPFGFTEAATIGGALSKTTPVDLDEIPIRDSVTPFGLRKLTWADNKTTLKTYFDDYYSVLGHAHSDLYSVLGHAHSDLYSVLGHTHSIYSGYDIVVYQSGGLTIAENGWTHVIIDSGTTGPTINTRVLNAAIAACPVNGSLYIGAGTYYLLASTSCTAGPEGYLTYNVAIPITKNIHITGAGIGATILMLAAGQHYTSHPALIMYAYHPYSDGGFGVAYTAFSLRRMTFDGNVSAQTIWYYDGSGLFLAGSMRYNARFEDLEFKNSACHGFYSGNHGAGWEVDGVFQNIRSYHNAYYDQIDNPERCILSGWDSYDCGYYATEIGLAIDTYTSGRRSITCSGVNIRKGGLYLFSYESETFNNDSVIQISNLHIDARETSHSALWIQHIGNIFIDGGFIRANPATNYAVWLQHAEVSLSDLEITGMRGIVSVASTTNTLECHDCNIISESHCIMPVTGDTYRFYGTEFTTNDNDAYLLAAAGGVTLELFSCTGGTNEYGVIILSGYATVSHNGTYRLGLETDGYSSVADAGTIAHNLKITPRFVTVQASLEGTIATPADLGASTFTVNFSGVTTTQTVYWHAKY